MPWTGERRETDMGWGEDAGTWDYTLLPDPQLSYELARLSYARTQKFNGIAVDSVTLQPCPNQDERSQDRLFAAECEFGLLAGVFDGHAGHETVDHAVFNLPPIILSSLPSCSSNPSRISALLSRTVSEFDASIGSAITTLFPDPASTPARHIHAVVNDRGAGQQAILRGMRGSTALLALVDRQRKNLWVSNLGDCQAVLGVKRAGRWMTRRLTQDHNGSNPSEVRKMHERHPREPNCMINNRVLGALAVTRALGDHLFKLPPIYTTRVFLESNEPFQFSVARPSTLASRCLTPPYLLSTPDVTHVNLAEHDGEERFLLLCSDGLPALYAYGDTPMSDQEIAKQWVRVVGRHIDSGRSGNLALGVLRDALGGGDIEKVSRNLTVEMFTRWMDDTTIQVLRI